MNTNWTQWEHELLERAETTRKPVPQLPEDPLGPARGIVYAATILGFVLMISLVVWKFAIPFVAAIASGVFH
jgi:hypothetical protein